MTDIKFVSSTASEEHVVELSKQYVGDLKKKSAPKPARLKWAVVWFFGFFVGLVACDGAKGVSFRVTSEFLKWAGRAVLGTP